ncbi:MAG: hypothetical protein J6F30_02970 [Cellulosilyticum sp.]|nr:hypothetical protein [Cellulosilyticum sp.]
MKHKIRLCLATTGLTLLLLSVIASFYHAQFLCLSTVYEVFLTTIVIYIGLALLEHFESPYYLIEILLEISYIEVILILFGFMFNWYRSLPLGLLILLGFLVYVIGCSIDLIRTNHHLAYINSKLKTHQKLND